LDRQTLIKIRDLLRDSRDALDRAERELNDLLAGQPGYQGTKYRGKQIRVALHEYLQEQGGEATFSACEHALKAGGCDLKAVPSKNLATVITRNPALFERRGQIVGLTRQAARLVVSNGSELKV
jgi:hypothetical protein